MTAGTRSPSASRSRLVASAALALVVDDPDAPRGTWTHWTLWNLEGHELGEGDDGGGTSGTNSWGRVGWGGPCPPSGTHRSVFTLTALDTRLDLPASARVEGPRAAVAGHVLGEARLMGRYGR